MTLFLSPPPTTKHAQWGGFLYAIRKGANSRRKNPALAYIQRAKWQLGNIRRERKGSGAGANEGATHWERKLKTTHSQLCVALLERENNLIFACCFSARRHTRWLLVYEIYYCQSKPRARREKWKKRRRHTLSMGMGNEGDNLLLMRDQHSRSKRVWQLLEVAYFRLQKLCLLFVVTPFLKTHRKYKNTKNVVFLIPFTFHWTRREDDIIQYFLFFKSSIHQEYIWNSIQWSSRFGIWDIQNYIADGLENGSIILAFVWKSIVENLIFGALKGLFTRRKNFNMWNQSLWKFYRHQWNSNWTDGSIFNEPLKRVKRRPY